MIQPCRPAFTTCARVTRQSSSDFGQDRFAVGRTANDAKAAPEEETSHGTEDGLAAARPESGEIHSFKIALHPPMLNPLRVNMAETPSAPLITVEGGEGIHVHAQVEFQEVGRDPGGVGSSAAQGGRA